MFLPWIDTVFPLELISNLWGDTLKILLLIKHSPCNLSDIEGSCLNHFQVAVMESFEWLLRECGGSCRRYFIQAMRDPVNPLHLPNSRQLFDDSFPCTALEKHCQLPSLSAPSTCPRLAIPLPVQSFSRQSKTRFLSLLLTFCKPISDPSSFDCYQIKFVEVSVVSKLLSHTFKGSSLVTFRTVSHIYCLNFASLKFIGQPDFSVFQVLESHFIVLFSY